jgi:hypothetical protein
LERNDMSPDETREFQVAVDRARERLDDLSALMVVANSLDRQAGGDVILDEDDDVPLPSS